MRMLRRLVTEIAAFHFECISKLFDSHTCVCSFACLKVVVVHGQNCIVNEICPLRQNEKFCKLANMDIFAKLDDFFLIYQKH